MYETLVSAAAWTAIWMAFVCLNWLCFDDKCVHQADFLDGMEYGNAWPIRQWDQDFFFVCASIDEQFYKISKLDNWISRVFHFASCSTIRPASVWLDHVHHSLVICIFSTFDIFCVLCIAEFFQWNPFRFFCVRFHVRVRIRVHISRMIRVRNEWRAISRTSAMCDPHSQNFTWGLTTFHSNFLFARMRTVAFVRSELGEPHARKQIVRAQLMVCVIIIRLHAEYRPVTEEEKSY